MHWQIFSAVGLKKEKQTQKQTVRRFLPSFQFYWVMHSYIVWAVIAYESGSISLLPYRLPTSVLLCATLLPVAPYGGEIGQWGLFSS